MINLTRLVKSTYSWLKPEGPVTLSNGVLLYAPGVIRAGAIIFCVVGVFFSILYSLEHWNDPRLVVTRVFVVGLACFTTFVVAILIERHYKVCVLVGALLGITVILLATTYMDGPNINPHAMLVLIYVLGAGLCLGRRGVIISLSWLILNFLILNVISGATIWPQPTSISVAQVQRENVSALFFMLLSLTPVLLGYLAVVERSIAEWRKAHSGQAQLLQRLIATREGERKHLSHVLHEGPVQDMGALRLAILNNEPSDDLVSLVDSSIRKLRDLSTSLHPPILELYGLPAALDQLAAQRGGSVQLQVDRQRLGRLDPHVEIALFRIVQEALTNSQKHSDARHMWVRLERSENCLVLEVRDDGQGFDTSQTLQRTIQAGHFGLATMHELATSIGGELEIASAPRQGTNVRVTAPYRALVPRHDSLGSTEDLVSEYGEKGRLV